MRIDNETSDGTTYDTSSNHLNTAFSFKIQLYQEMKLSTASLLLALGTASAFAPSSISSTSQHSTRLNLFGGGNKAGGDKKAGGGGMMDQLAMFKKAQEIATKKKKLDEELAKMEFIGEGVDGKVKAEFKFLPITSPMDPNPDYEAVAFEFDEEWYESASPEDLSAGVKEAIEAGIKTANEAVVEKYQTLQGDLAKAMAGAQAEGGDAPAEES